MVGIDIKEIIKTVLSGTKELAKNLLGGYIKEASEDGSAFLLASEEKLKQWSIALSLGNLSVDEFVSLVNGQKDLMKLKALKQVGLAQIKLDEFRIGLIDLLTHTVLKAIGI